jgi:hypothetical protein
LSVCPSVDVYISDFSRTSEPKSIKLGTYYPLVKRNQVCSNKGLDPLQRGDNRKNVKNGVGSYKNLILKNYEARKDEFYMKDF